MKHGLLLWQSQFSRTVYQNDIMFNMRNITGIDTDGGVRLPAGNCAVLGFRPSHGTVSLSGVIPVSGSLDTVGMYSKGYSQMPAI